MYVNFQNIARINFSYTMLAEMHTLLYELTSLLLANFIPNILSNISASIPNV